MIKYNKKYLNIEQTDNIFSRHIDVFYLKIYLEKRMQ